MPHNPLDCLWRRWIRPWIMSDSTIVGNPPSEEKYSEQMQKLTLQYIYHGENLEDFATWVRDHRPSSKGAIQWDNYFDTDEGELVCSPMPGPVLIIFSIILPAIIGATVISTSIIGVMHIFSSKYA